MVRRNRGFTLIELLVVISIIALLIAILLPTLGKARDSARASQSLSNVRQMGIGMTAYVAEYRGYFFKHESWYNAPGVFAESSDPSGGWARRTHWPDHVFPYASVASIYRSPLLTADEQSDFVTKFTDNQFWDPGNTYKADAPFHGGYGWNYQYLGSDRRDANGLPFYARMETDVLSPTNTVAIGDTAGSRRGVATNRPGQTSAAVYVIDPPLGSINLGSRGARRTGAVQAYYQGGTDDPTGTPETYLWRSFPALRNNGVANMVYVDGHGEGVSLEKIDDYDRDGVKDNGYWNGRANALLR
jgi:prepilin-type N-terminal cleavage/methylation domain-containing protein/prepilin-type processing-associated H-X9-DG protein